jgi:hypothetical protein
MKVLDLSSRTLGVFSRFEAFLMAITTRPSHQALWCVAVEALGSELGTLHNNVLRVTSM